MKCDSLIQPRLGGIQSGQGGCRKCGISSSAKTRTYTAEEAKKIALKKSLQPLEPYQGSASKWKCKCLRCGKVSSPRFSAIRDGKHGCLWCAKKIVDPIEARKKMMVAKLKPLVSYPGSDKGWLCECLICKREVTPTYGSIRSGQGGCKWCKKVAPRIDPMFATQFFLQKDIQPLEPFKSSHSNWKSRCLRCENQINPRYHDVKQGGGGCKYCAPNFVNENRILKVMNDALLVPQEKYPGSKANWKVLHKTCGRIFKIQYQNLRKGGSCRYCAGKAVIPKEAVEAMRRSGFKPLSPYNGANKPWKCKCLVCNRIVYPTYGSVVGRGGGCAYCTGLKVDVKDAKKLMRMNNLEPLEPFPGAGKKWKCKCQVCKRTVSPRYTSIQSGQGGCRWCAEWGIDYSSPGYLYLMTNPEFSAHKLGIGNAIRSRGRNRIEQHEKFGWELYKRMDFEITDDAFHLEQKVLTWLRGNKGLPAYLSEFEMPQGGYSETVDAMEIDLPTIWAKVREMSKVKK
jgi:recombinational DNA repair protein (RecF pathway)